MPVSDISYITRTYIDLIRRAFRNSPAWSLPDLPDVFPVSPVNLKDGIGFYLYHVIQKKEYDNIPVPTRKQEIRFLPMALTLYYQLTATSDADDETAAYQEQLMMSIAMKAIHDCPFINDSTVVPNIPNTAPTLILDPNIRGNNNFLDISQQPVPYTEAVHNWTAGQAPMRLSAYYEVSTVLLQPDDITSYTGRVLAYGNYVFQKSAPRITSSQNIITYTAPGETVAREIKVQPAQAPPSPPAPAAASQASIAAFFGAGFEGGEVSLRLLHPRFKETVIASADWDLTVTGVNSLAVTIREAATQESDNAVVAILPGVYAVQVVVKKSVQLPGGSTKEFKSSSNQFPLLISPRINEPLAALVNSTLTITGYCFKSDTPGEDLLKDAIEIYTGETRLTRNHESPVNPAVVAAGEFKVINKKKIIIGVPGVLNAGMQIPLRIIVDGAEAGPLWIIV